MGGRRTARRLTNESPETAAVDAMTPEGWGIATVEGKRVFIRGALRGETVTFQRVRSRRNYDEARILEVCESSPDREKPRCRYFGTCGGCTLQHLSPAAQVRLKEGVLLDSLRRIGSVEPGRLLAPVTGTPWGYRRRARLAVRQVDGKGRVLVGFSERDSSKITDMRGCETLLPAVAALLEPLSMLIGSLSVSRRIPQVEVAAGDDGIALVFRCLDEPTTTDTAAMRAFAIRHGVKLLLQSSGPKALQPLESRADGEELWYELERHELRLGFDPADFIQVNAEVNRRMVDLAVDLLDPGMTTRAIDLYCGIGNFTLALARKAGIVLGVEGSATAVARARRNAALNGIGNAHFMVADLSSTPDRAEWARQHFDVALLDPPRAGAAAALAPLAATGVQRIVYISCHPGTLARDAGVLVRDLGYALCAAGILDMFPATSHVESVASFERR